MPIGPTVLPLCVPSWKIFFITFKSAYDSNSGHTDKKVNGSWRKVGKKMGERSQEQTGNYCHIFYKIKEAKLIEKLFVPPIEN